LSRKLGVITLYSEPFEPQIVQFVPNKVESYPWQAVTKLLFLLSVGRNIIGKGQKSLTHISPHVALHSRSGGSQLASRPALAASRMVAFVELMQQNFLIGWHCVVNVPSVKDWRWE
jgi:hypothetical protein